MDKKGAMNDESTDRSDRKRKSCCQELHPIPPKHPLELELEDDEDEDLLTLSLTFPPNRSRRASVDPQQQPQPQSQPPIQSQLQQQQQLQRSLLHQQLQTQAQQQQQQQQQWEQSQLKFQPYRPMAIIPPGPSSHMAASAPVQQGGIVASPVRQPRVRRNPTQAPKEGKSDAVPPPFPWATAHRATVHSLEHLESNGMTSIGGEVQCKRCEKKYQIEYNLHEKFDEIANFIARNKILMHERAPAVWTNPILPTCQHCRQENSVKPVMAEKKKEINWLFLLLGQLLGCCTLEQLKYFCKHTRNHRTGAKDRVLYLTYLSLCNQLQPNRMFNR